MKIRNSIVALIAVLAIVFAPQLYSSMSKSGVDLEFQGTIIKHYGTVVNPQSNLTSEYYLLLHRPGGIEHRLFMNRAQWEYYRSNEVKVYYLPIPKQ